MNKNTIEIQVTSLVDDVATSAARHAFIDSVKRAKASYSVAEWPEILKFVQEEALDCARLAAFQIATDFNVHGTFDDDSLAFVSTSNPRLS